MRFANCYWQYCKMPFSFQSFSKLLMSFVGMESPHTLCGGKMLVLQKILNVNFFLGGKTQWGEKNCISDISLPPHH
jgi:hypothetical protein